MKANNSANSFSKREREILALLIKGESNSKIADTLFISVSTVKTHIYHIYQKLGVKNRLQIIDLIINSDQAKGKHSHKLVAELIELEKTIFSKDQEKSFPSRFLIKDISISIKKPWCIIGLFIIIILSAAALFLKSEKRTLGLPSEIIMMVVLPFENLGLPEDDYYADGINDEISSRLADLYRIGVISRTSTFQYRDTEKTTRQIGRELEVDYLLEGTVRWNINNRGRILLTIQLIRVSDDTCIWVKTFDRIVSDIFATQVEIAEQVAEQLDLKFRDMERKNPPTRLTDNVQAYNYYFQGKRNFLQAFNNIDIDGFNRAVSFFEKAIELDSGFLSAYLHQAQTHLIAYETGGDRSEARLIMAKNAIDGALKLQPGSPEAKTHLAKFYYRWNRDYDRALEILNEVRKIRPHLVYPLIGYIQRRQGLWEDAARSFEKGFKYDPRNFALANQLGFTLIFMRRYKEARKWFDRSLAINPGHYYSKFGNAEVAFLEGDIQYSWLITKTLASHPFTFLWKYSLNMYQRNYQKNLDLLRSNTPDSFITSRLYIPKDLIYATVYHAKKEEKLKKSHAEKACKILERALEENPDDPRILAALGLAKAYGGLYSEAVKTSRRAVDLYPVSKDSYAGSDHVVSLAKVYTICGRNQEAVDQLEYLMSIPCDIEASIQALKLDPIWDPLRENQRFIQLLNEKAAH